MPESDARSVSHTMTHGGAVDETRGDTVVQRRAEASVPGIDAGVRELLVLHHKLHCRDVPHNAVFGVHHGDRPALEKQVTVLFLSLPLSVCLSVCLSVSVWLCLCLSVSVCLSVSLSLSLSLSLS